MSHRIHVLYGDEQVARGLAADLERLGHRASWCVGSPGDCLTCTEPGRCRPLRRLLMSSTAYPREHFVDLPSPPVEEAAPEAIFCEIGPLLLYRMSSSPGVSSCEPGSHGTHLVVVSWMGSGADILEFSDNCGAGGVLAAPWTLDELASVVGAVFSRPAPARRQTSEPILVVEDDPTQLSLILAVLRNAGYQLLLAADAETALRIAARSKPVLLLTDNCLPGLQGVPLIEEFRRLHPTAATVLCTSYGSEGLARAALLAGVDDYLSKPLSPQVLLTVVGRALLRRNLRCFESYLHQHHRELGRTVLALRHRESVQARLQAELLQTEKLSTVGALLSGIAHELNNPLAVMVGFTEQALQEPGCPDEVKSLLEKAREGGQRCVSIVKDLLGLVRKSTGEFRPLDIHEPIEGISRLRGRQLALEGIELVTEFDRALPSVITDGPRLAQVVLNLVNNAADALLESKCGSVIRIRTHEQAGAVVISVHDDGPLIPSELLEHVFTPFFTTKPPGKGTGLGLSISRDIAALLGGTLTLTNGPGGVTFHLTVPFEPPGYVQSEEPVPPRLESISFEGARILIVDDEPAILQLLTRILINDGAEVQSAADGGQAIGLLERGWFDLIVCDLKMPGKNGVEVYQYLQSHRPELTRRLLFASGDSSGEVARGLIESEVVPVLRKPYTRDEVRQAVGLALRRLGTCQAASSGTAPV